MEENVFSLLMHEKEKKCVKICINNLPLMPLLQSFSLQLLPPSNTCIPPGGSPIKQALTIQNPNKVGVWPKSLLMYWPLIFSFSPLFFFVHIHSLNTWPGVTFCLYGFLFFFLFATFYSHSFLPASFALFFLSH